MCVGFRDLVDHGPNNSWVSKDHPNVVLPLNALMRYIYYRKKGKRHLYAMDAVLIESEHGGLPAAEDSLDRINETL